MANLPVLKRAGLAAAAFLVPRAAASAHLAVLPPPELAGVPDIQPLGSIASESPIAIGAFLGLVLLMAAALWWFRRHPTLRNLEYSNVVAAVALALPAASCVGLVLLVQSEVRSRHDWMDHSVATMGKIEQVAQRLILAESSSRRFVLSKDTHDRDAYRRVAAELTGQVDGLARLVRDNPRQSAHFHQLAGLIRTKLALSNQAVMLADSAAPRARELAQSELWTQLTLDARTQLSDMRGEELQLLDARQHKAESVQRLAVALTAASGLLALLGLAASIWIATREGRARSRLESALKASRARYRAAAAEAAEANLAKSEFLASMSHELRTPLNAVIGFAQVLLMDGREPPSPRQQEYLDYILRGGHQLLALINDVLDLAKIEAGQLNVSLERIELANILDEFAATMENLARAQGIAFHLGQVEPAGSAVLADYSRLLQVLMNLGTNAIKYNRPGGSVLVAIGEAPNDRERIRLTVRDTGIGIPLERQPDLFQAFNRLGAEQSAIEGTGIGLNICLRLMQLMQGDIGFASEPGRGSEFWIELPKAKRLNAPPLYASALVNQWQDSGPADEAAFTVLYIEDNPASTALLKHMLESNPGIRVLSAPTGEGGLTLAALHQPDVIISDINLPDISGYDVLQRLRAQPETAAIPVIALSADALPRDMERGRAAGFHDYMTKPFAGRDLIAAIAEARTATRH